METNAEENIHALGKRTFETGRGTNCESGAGFVRRSFVDNAVRGTVQEGARDQRNETTQETRHGNKGAEVSRAE